MVTMIKGAIGRGKGEKGKQKKAKKIGGRRLTEEKKSTRRHTEFASPPGCARRSTCVSSARPVGADRGRDGIVSGDVDVASVGDVDACVSATRAKAQTELAWSKLLERVVGGCRSHDVSNTLDGVGDSRVPWSGGMEDFGNE